MNVCRQRFLQLAIGLACLPATFGLAAAQTYPNRPITVVVPYTAGSPTDLVARVILDKMGATLGQAIVVENVGGAGGSIGASRVARAEADGYTLCVGNNGSHVLSGALYTLNFDVLKDFAPISRLTTNSQIIITNNSIPAQNLKELVALMKGERKMTAGVAGPMAVVSILDFQNKASAPPLQLVPYRGTVGPIQDLIAGHIDLMVDQVSNAAPFVRAGTVRAYAVAAKTRSPSLPDVPTVDEAGLPGLYGAIWTGLWAPKGTPAEIVARLAAVTQEALADPAVRNRLSDIGFEIVPVDQQTPDALAAYQKAEVDMWWPLAKAANLKGN
jgi:tripartite-type tricarboxylate transporter receptor subunit TctC